MSKQVKITKEFDIDNETVSVDIWGEYEEGGVTADFAERGWGIVDWQAGRVISIPRTIMINKALSGKDFSSDFEAALQDQREAAMEQRAGI